MARHMPDVGFLGPDPKGQPGCPLARALPCANSGSAKHFALPGVPTLRASGAAGSYCSISEH